jgi:hypothetical protein
MRFLSFDCIANQEAEHTRRESIKLLKKARMSVKIVAGNLSADFYSNPQVLKALSSARTKGASIEIAHYPTMGVDVDKTINLLQEHVPGIKIWTLQKVPARHMLSIDGKHVRIERRHVQGAQETPALICRNASLLAKELDNKFEALAKN